MEEGLILIWKILGSLGVLLILALTCYIVVAEEGERRPSQRPYIAVVSAWTLWALWMVWS